MDMDSHCLGDLVRKNMADAKGQDAIRARNLVLKIIKNHEKSNGLIEDVNAFINVTLCEHPDLNEVSKQLVQSIARKKLDPDGIFLKRESDLANSATTKVPSLNQSMASIQKQQQMKRHRPEDPSVPSGSESGKLSSVPSQTNLVDENAAEAPERKRRVISSSNRSSSSNSATSKSTMVSPFLTERPSIRFSNLAGLDKVIVEMKELVCHPQEYQGLYRELGVCPPCGILLHGPSGCGKSALAQATAGETGLAYFKVSGPELVGGTSGESEENIRKVFDAALSAAPSILFIDAFEALAPRRDQNSRGMDRRIIAQLFDSVDSLIQASKEFYQRPNSSTANDTPVPHNASATIDVTGIETNPSTGTAAAPNNTANNGEKVAKSGFVVLIVATNKPEQLDPGVRGRFAREIALPVPDAPARTSILRLQTQDMKISSDVDYVQLGKLTPGFVGSDLQVLARQAGLLAVSRLISSQHTTPDATTTVIEAPIDVAMDVVSAEDKLEEEGDKRAVTMDDFLRAIKTVQPTAKREGFAIAPDVTWQDVGALSEVREELKHNVLEPIAHPERFRALGLEVPAGVLFYGPPGCGKTLLAKALANQSGANFISVKGPELLNMYVGESESRVRQVFARARASAPCVIFFDELDALCPRRSSGWDGAGGSGSGGSGNNVSERVVNQLLTELDGLESRRDVYIIAATNRLELIDEAMLRPGRLGNLLYVPLPSASDRVSILRALTRKVAIHEIDIPINNNNRSNSHKKRNTVENISNGLYGESDVVQLEEIARDSRCDGFTGADLSALVREAGLAVIKELSAANELALTNTTATNENEGGTRSEQKTTKICGRHFEEALSKVKPSVSPQDRVRYEKVRHYLKQGLSAIEALRMGYEEAYLQQKQDE